eukprot:scaffold620_cov177-Ochromonas_danica.AAC.19
MTEWSEADGMDDPMTWDLLTCRSTHSTTTTPTWPTELLRKSLNILSIYTPPLLLTLTLTLTV